SSPPSLTLYAANRFTATHDQTWIAFKDARPVDGEPAARAFVFDPPGDLGVKGGEPVSLEVEVGSAGFKQRFRLPSYTYDPWAWWRENWKWGVPLTAIVALVVLVLSLWAVKPDWLLWLYTKGHLYQAPDVIAVEWFKFLKGPLKLGLRLICADSKH